METEQVYEYYGLMQLSEMTRKQLLDMEGKQIQTGVPVYEDDIIHTYRTLIQIHPSYAQDLAVYYELNDFPEERIEHYYHLAIREDDTPRPLFNLADYYKKHKRYTEMIQCFQRAVSEFRDVDSMVMLAMYYAAQRNVDTANLYYTMALDTLVKKDKLTSKYTIISLVDTPEIVYMMDFIQGEGWDQKNGIYDELVRLSSSRSSVAVYRTKVRLFESLHHVTECGVCFNIELHLDLKCGHCVCKDCYLKLFSRACPYCRR
jgi:tetratricopeptide (TPR) repeat protein